MFNTGTNPTTTGTTKRSRFRWTVVGLAYLILVFPVSGLSQNPFGQFSASTYLGYSFGMGEMFRNTESVTSRVSSTAGASFGAILHYSLSAKTQIGLELMLQDYTYEVETIGNPVNTNGKIRTDILLHTMWRISKAENRAVHLIFGGGYYDFVDGGAGVNAGLLYRGSDISGTAIFFSPRIHFSLADSGELYQMMQLTVGIRLPL